MTHDHLDSAYATLGLTHDASSSAVKRQYKALVRKWHPDRFIDDPQGIAEATLMLKAVNHAYSTIHEDGSAHAFTGKPRNDSSSQAQVSLCDPQFRVGRTRVADCVSASEKLRGLPSR